MAWHPGQRGKACSSDLGFTVIGMGFSVGSGVISDGILTSVTAGCHTMLFDVPAPIPGDPTCVSSGSTTIHAISEFAYSDIRSAGHIEFQSGQAHVFTDDATREAKVAGYIAASSTKLGTFSVNWTGTGVARRPGRAQRRITRQRIDPRVRGRPRRQRFVADEQFFSTAQGQCT